MTAAYEIPDHEIASRFLGAAGADDGTAITEQRLVAWLEQMVTALSEAMVAAKGSRG